MNRYKVPHLIISLIIFALPSYLGLLILSRIPVLIAALLLYFTICAVYTNGKLLDKKILALAALATPVLLVFSTFVLTQRLDNAGVSFAYSIVNSVYAYAIAAKPAALSSIIRGDEFWSGFYSIVLPNSMYYLQGPYEFSLQWTRPEEQTFTYGAYLIEPYYKGVAALLQIEREKLFQEVEVIYRPGAWGSFFTPLWVDFGWLSLLFMAVFGGFLSITAEKVKKGATNILPLYLYCQVVVFFFPLLNLLIAGLGTYTVTTLVLFAVCMQRRSVYIDPDLPPQRAEI
jgi:hypothetical protein